MASPGEDYAAVPCSSTNDTVSVVNKEDKNDYDVRLQEYEEMFKDRYTTADKWYVESINNRINPPPIVHPWYNRQRRNFDYNNRGRRGADNRWTGRGRHWSDRGRGHNRNSYHQNNHHRYNPY